MKTYDLNQLYQAVPKSRRKKGIYLSPKARAMGVRISATKGTGKSRLSGRIIVYGDFLQGIPTLVIDPVGGLIADVLDKISRCPKDVQRELWKRIRYVDMAGLAGEDGEQRVIPFPVYNQEYDESPFVIANRYIDVIARIDPALANAPLLGLNAFKRAAINVGMLLSALGWQITEAEELLRNPKPYSEQIISVATTPELKKAAKYVLETVPSLKPQERDMQLSAFLSKIEDFQLDPVLKAMFGASTPGIDWHEVERKKQTVLIDFSRVEGEKRIPFLMFWVYWSFIRYIKQRGAGKDERHTPWSLVFDEITYLLGDPKVRNELLAKDLVELTDRISRSHNVWLTIVHQELNQLSEQVQETFMRIGTQIFGSTSDPESALLVARRFMEYRPHLVKAADAVYSEGEQIDTRYSYFSIDEQREINSRPIMGLRKFRFLIGLSEDEGHLATELVPFTISHIDRDLYADGERVRLAKQRLMERDGMTVSEVQNTIAERLRTAPRKVQSTDDDDSFYEPLDEPG
ncbi:MAG: hypothetical protein ACR2IV_17525 [Bryobacteraceae bacterium]